MPDSLEKEFRRIEANLPNTLIPLSRLFSLVDLTRLDRQASEEELMQLGQIARQQQVAAICVFPQHLQHIPSLTGIQRATVVNFPGGDHKHKQVLQDIEQAITIYQADEIDYVFSYAKYLEGDKHQALVECREVYQLCQAHGRLCKVILETGAHPSMAMTYQISCDVIQAGCDMLKTSTGKISMGAALPAVFAILSAIQNYNPQCGIKCSGGIKTSMQASPFIHLAETILHKAADKTWLRIGASAIAQHPPTP